MAPAPASTETWPARFSDQGSPGSRAAVSVHPETRQRPADAVAGLLASLSIFASLVGLAYRPARLIPGALPSTRSIPGARSTTRSERSMCATSPTGARPGPQ